MSKHTPGPWSTYVNAKDDTVIRKMFPDEQECCEIARCKTGFANARLIAAAPDLYDSCIKAGSVLKTALDEISDSAAKQVIERTLEQIAAAIAKAEGRA